MEEKHSLREIALLDEGDVKELVVLFLRMRAAGNKVMFNLG